MASCSVLPYHTERCLGSEAHRFVVAWFPHLALPLEAPLEYRSHIVSTRNGDSPYQEVVP